jgi:hypothetical protein
MHKPLTVLIRECGMTPESFHRAVKPFSRMDLVTLLKSHPSAGGPAERPCRDPHDLQGLSVYVFIRA